MADLRGAALDVERRSGATLNNYVLFTNIDLTAEQQRRLETVIAEGLDDHDVRIGVVGAASLSAMLNQLPHVRSAFFATAAFRTWEDSWDAHRRVVAFPQTEVSGRDDELATLRTWISDPGIRVIALSGSHMMGKTRLVLEATRQCDVTFVEALDRQAERRSVPPFVCARSLGHGPR